MTASGQPLSTIEVILTVGVNSVTAAGTVTPVPVFGLTGNSLAIGITLNAAAGTSATLLVNALGF